MTTALSGRALDEAAARAMGWEPASKDGLAGKQWFWRKGHQETETWDLERLAHPPEFSYHPACLDEMLRHLRGWLTPDRALDIQMTSDGFFAVATEYHEDSTRVIHTAPGATIYEAVARLVVAVGEAKT